MDLPMPEVNGVDAMAAICAEFAAARIVELTYRKGLLRKELLETIRSGPCRAKKDPARGGYGTAEYSTDNSLSSREMRFYGSFRAVARSPVVRPGALSSFWVCSIESRFPQADALRSDALNACGAVGELCCQQPVIASFDAQLAHRDDPNVDRTASSPRASRAMRQAFTVAFVKPGRGSRRYHSKNSSTPRFQTRRDLVDAGLATNLIQ
jgi:hypothetical protein